MKELDVVRLKSEFCDLPIGTTGTIVLEYDGIYSLKRSKGKNQDLK